MPTVPEYACFVSVKTERMPTLLMMLQFGFRWSSKTGSSTIFWTGRVATGVGSTSSACRIWVLLRVSLITTLGLGSAGDSLAANTGLTVGTGWPACGGAGAHGSDK